MKFAIGLLFFISAISVSVNAAEQPGVRYYGYYNSEEFTLETADHSNLAFLNGSPDNERFMQQFHGAINKNMKVMVGVSSLFFDGKNLRGDYLSRWNFLKTEIAGLANYIAAFYVTDEPTRIGISRSDIQAAINEIRSVFPNVPTASIFDTDHIDGLVNMFDWVGFDCYDNGNSSCDPDATYRGVPKTRYENLRSRLDASRQKMILVPQAAYIYRSYTNNNDYHRNEMESELLVYHQIALTDPLVVAAIPFMWQSGVDGKNVISGLRDMATDPNYNHSININLYKDFGRDVSKRANALYPVILSPTHVSILATFLTF